MKKEKNEFFEVYGNRPKNMVAKFLGTLLLVGLCRDGLERTVGRNWENVFPNTQTTQSAQSIESMRMEGIEALIPGGYTVKDNDTLSEIAEQYHATVPELMKVNSRTIKNPNLIYPGQRISIPAEGYSNK